MKKLIVGIPLIIIAMFIWSFINSPLIVTVTGLGEVDIQVTSSTLTFSAISDGDDPAAAIGNVKAKADNLKNILKDTGVTETNIIESQVTVVPTSTIIAGASGFKASVVLGAKNISTNKLDMLITSLYVNGATLVSQPTIAATNQKELEKQAVSLAMKDAQKQADTIARNNWKFIKKAISITQSSTPTNTVTGKESLTNPNSPGVGKIVSQVLVSYKMW